MLYAGHSTSFTIRGRGGGHSPDTPPANGPVDVAGDALCDSGRLRRYGDRLAARRLFQTFAARFSFSPGCLSSGGGMATLGLEGLQTAQKRFSAIPLEGRRLFNAKPNLARGTSWPKLSSVTTACGEQGTLRGTSGDREGVCLTEPSGKFRSARNRNLRLQVAFQQRHSFVFPHFIYLIRSDTPPTPPNPILSLIFPPTPQTPFPHPSPPSPCSPTGFNCTLSFSVGVRSLCQMFCTTHSSFSPGVCVHASPGMEWVLTCDPLGSSHTHFTRCSVLCRASGKLSGAKLLRTFCAVSGAIVLQSWKRRRGRAVASDPDVQYALTQNLFCRPQFCTSVVEHWRSIAWC